MQNQVRICTVKLGATQLLYKQKEEQIIAPLQNIFSIHY